MTLPLADFTLLLSTTDEYGLLQPCRERMKLLLRFEFYSESELGDVLRHRSKALRWTVEETVFPEIAKRAKGTPRLALRLLQSARRCSRAEGDNTITLDTSSGLCVGTDRQPGTGTDRDEVPRYSHQRGNSVERFGLHVGLAVPNCEPKLRSRSWCGRVSSSKTTKDDGN